MLFPFFLKIDMINICLTRIEILHKSETIIMTFQIVWVIRLYRSMCLRDQLGLELTMLRGLGKLYFKP